MPFTNPRNVSLVLQDRDTVTEENWATSVLVKDETYGSLKTKVAEHWASAKGFDARRIDRRLSARDRLEDDDPRVALSGVDKVEARRLMAGVGFDCIVDAGLGRTASDFDRYRVTVFDRACPIDKYFAGLEDKPAGQDSPTGDAYQRLEAEIGTVRDSGDRRSQRRSTLCQCPCRIRLNFPRDRGDVQLRMPHQ